MAARKKTARKKTARKAARKSAAAAKPAVKPKAKAASPKPTKKKSSRKQRTATRVARRRSAAKPVEAPAFPEIEALAELMEKHGLNDVSYTREADGSTSLHVSKGGMPAALSAMSLPSAVAPAPQVAAAEPVAEAAPAPAADEDLHAFKSPMVGTFYRAPSPEASPFSTTGDSVDPSSVVCIIEAMKVMNEINPDLTGEIVSIEVENGEAVEFGQTLMLIRPR